MGGNFLPYPRAFKTLPAPTQLTAGGSVPRWDLSWAEHFTEHVGTSSHGDQLTRGPEFTQRPELDQLI